MKAPRTRMHAAGRETGRSSSLQKDEAIIGFELAESLGLLKGSEVVGPFDTCASAETWLKSTPEARPELYPHRQQATGSSHVPS